MKAVLELIKIFLILNSGISGHASTEIHLQQSQSTAVPVQHPLIFDSHRIPKQLQPTQNIYSSKNFIKSKLPQNNGQPQLFNLGYSVRFDNQQSQNVQHAIEKPKFINNQNADIITGTRKQNVEIDLPSNPNEISQFIIKNDIQKRKAFGSKLTATPQMHTNTYLENMGQSYISHTTQQNLEALGKIKDVDHQQELSDLYQQKYTWRNLSPNVKIIRSTEIPTERIENRALDFDHEKALSKSEGFGFSDAMRAETLENKVYSNKEPKLNHVKIIPTTPAPEEFRVIHVQEQINEPPIKQTIITDPDMFTLSQNSQQEDLYQSKLQIQPQTKVVKISPTSILQAVDGTPLKPQVQQQEVILAQMPKQNYIQHMLVPQMTHESFPKYRGKHKYVKHVPGMRGTLVYPRKVVSNLDHFRKGKIKRDMRREVKPPPTSSLV